MNDRLDVALAANIDGVHLPSDGLPARRVRPFVNISEYPCTALKKPYPPKRLTRTSSCLGQYSKLPENVRLVSSPCEVAPAVRIPVLAIGGITPAEQPRDRRGRREWHCGDTDVHSAGAAVLRLKSAVAGLPGRIPDGGRKTNDAILSAKGRAAPGRVCRVIANTICRADKHSVTRRHD